MLLIKNAKHQIGGEIYTVDVLVKSGVIADISPEISPSSQI